MLDPRVNIGICDGGYVLTADGVVTCEEDEAPDVEVQPVCRVCTSEESLLHHVKEYLYAYRAWEARVDGKDEVKLDQLPKAKRT